MARDHLPREVGFIVRLNEQRKNKLRRSGERAIQEGSIADRDAVRWDCGWCVWGTEKIPVVEANHEQGQSSGETGPRS